MGNTFSTIQIKNSNQEKPSDMLLKYMAKKGYVQTDEDNAQLTYRLVYSDKSDWVTFLSQEYENGSLVQEDAEGIAKILKTYCIAVGVWDSDMLTLDLYSPKPEQKDKVFVGRPPGDGFPVGKANQKLWKELIVEGKSWEELSSVFNDDYTFIEDSLIDIAPFLGMDSDIIRNYRHPDAPEQDNVSDFLQHFKKKDEKKKSISFNSAFKQIYGKALEPLGFKLIKSKYPYFVRLIGDEILHVITYKNIQCFRKDYKEFSIEGGVATVYRQNIDLTCNVNSNWLRSNADIYGRVHPFDCDYEYRKSISSFSYNVNDVKSMLYKINCSLEVTKEIMLPTIDEVISLNSFIEYQHKLNIPMRIYDDDEFGNKNGNNFYNEGLLYIKTNNHDDFKEKTKKSLKVIAHLFEIGRVEGSYERVCQNAEEGRNIQVTRRDNIYSNPKLYTKAMVELERRKIENIKTLRSHGINI